jgi:hypothetical protein
MEQYDEQGLGYKVQWLNMTSQKWLTENDTDRSIWWHYMVCQDALTGLDRGRLSMRTSTVICAFGCTITDWTIFARLKFSLGRPLSSRTTSTRRG